MELTMQRCFQTVDLAKVQSKPLNRGFTMIELMVVLAIMAIITLVAYPSYQESMRKTRRSDGIAAALALQVAQEKFRANCTVYASAFGTDNVCTPLTMPPVFEVQASSLSPEGFYTLAISGATGNAYVITATPQGAQAADTACNPMVITFGAGEPVKTPASCWP